MLQTVLNVLLIASFCLCFFLIISDLFEKRKKEKEEENKKNKKNL